MACYGVPLLPQNECETGNDNDQDGFPACLYDGQVATSTEYQMLDIHENFDCDDSDPEIHPNTNISPDDPAFAIDYPDDLIDQNCDGYDETENPAL